MKQKPYVYSIPFVPPRTDAVIHTSRTRFVNTFVRVVSRMQAGPDGTTHMLQVPHINHI